MPIKAQATYCTTDGDKASFSLTLATEDHETALAQVRAEAHRKPDYSGKLDITCWTVNEFGGKLQRVTRPFPDMVLNYYMIAPVVSRDDALWYTLGDEQENLYGDWWHTKEAALAAANAAAAEHGGKVQWGVLAHENGGCVVSVALFDEVEDAENLLTLLVMPFRRIADLLDNASLQDNDNAHCMAEDICSQSSNSERL